MSTELLTDTSEADRADAAVDAAVEAAAPESLVEDELLVEEISIDGMCGVY